MPSDRQALSTGINPAEFPAFRPRLPWIGGDLQTLRDSLVRDADQLPVGCSKQLDFPMPDGSGDRLLGYLDQPGKEGTGRPLAVLIHGLTGCSDSRYVRRAAIRLLGAGYPVLRLNLRGAGPCRSICRQQYHSGRSEDLRAVLDQIPAMLSREGIVAVGWSLGGNLLLKALGEFGGDYPIRAAVAVSAPIQLADAAGRLADARNLVYHRWLLARMRDEALRSPEPLSTAEHAQLVGARDIIAFDDRFTAPRNGFAGASDYYAKCSAAAFMHAIPVPTLVIHALDDPWIPGDAYLGFDWSANTRLTPLLSRRGGHVGFHAADGRVWSDECMVAFLERNVAGEAQPALRRWAASIAK